MQNLLTVLLMIFRFTMGAGIITFWPKIMKFLARRFQWSQELLALFKHLRWRVAGWLILIELVVVQNILGKCLEFVIS